ncbi:MAG: tetratricopeptide repeat protein [Alphaproteobacteria bacterium]|nr:tetratricopeptide repeat protein [Alphaproteobacteria bacterium]
MFEKYFEYALAIFLFGILILPYVVWRVHTKLRYLQKLACINVMKRQQTLPDKAFFSSDILNITVKKLYFCRSKQAQKALVRLVGGKTQSAAEYFSETDTQLSLLLTAYYDATRTYRQMKRKSGMWVKSPQYGIYLPILAYLAHNQKFFKSNYDRVQKNVKFRKGKPLDACNKYISSYVYLQAGDMLSASQNASEALKIFQKYHYSAEEAEIYLLLAEIYRLSCVNDVAFSMLQSALKIYRMQKLWRCEAETIALIGRQFLFENRYEEALAKYDEAMQIASNDNLKADIYNQLALVHLVQNRLAKAAGYVKIALDIAIKNGSKPRIAFSQQLCGHISFNRQHYFQAHRYFAAAADLYANQKNKSAYLECLYLSAETYYKREKYKEAEKILRQILDSGNLCGHSFHMANAYSLLGLIYIQIGDYKRARALILQSLNLEHSNNRCEGLTADYANLALIDAKCGNLLSADKNLQTAREYAQKTGDDELMTLIENRLKPLT